MPDNILSPKRIAAQAFTDAAAAVARLAEIYERNVSFLRAAFEADVRGEPLDGRVPASYPFVRITTGTHARLDSRLSYGFVSGPGMYETSVTRPDLFRGYFTEQIGLLMQNHGVPVEIGESDEPIPIHFAYRRDINIERVYQLTTGRCVICSTRQISLQSTTRSSTARCLPARDSRSPCSVLLAWIIHCTGSTTTPERIRSTSRTL